jgi:hypothetical protein
MPLTLHYASGSPYAWRVWPACEPLQPLATDDPPVDYESRRRIQVINVTKSAQLRNPDMRCRGIAFP